MPEVPEVRRTARGEAPGAAHTSPVAARRVLAAARRAALIGAALLVPLLAGCGGSSSSGSSDKGGTTTSAAKSVLTIGVQTAPTNLDPANSSNLGTPIPGQLWGATLLQDSAADGAHGPGLAAKFGYVGRGNTTYQLTLRKDARFSDGKPVTAAAVKAWLEYYAHAGQAGAGLIPIASIDTPDRWTVRIHLQHPDSGIEGYIGQGWGWGYVAEVDHPRSLASDPIGAGPYALVASETLPGDHYTLVPNKYYYDPSKIHYSKVVVKVIKSPTTMLQAIKSGELDIAIGDYTTAPAAQAAGLNVAYAPAGWAGLLIEDRNGVLAKPLGDVRVRQALNYAIDRRAITQAMLGKYGQPTSELRTLDAFDPSYQNHYPYDPAKAKQLLAAAGYPNGITFRVLDKSYVGNMGDPAMQAVAQYFSAVGIHVQITTAASDPEYSAKQESKAFPAEFENPPGPAMQGWFACCMEKGAPANKFGWSDPVMERLAKQAAVAPNADVQGIWRAVSRRSVDVAAFLPVFTTPTIVYSTSRVAGVSVTPWFYFAPVMVQWHPK